MQNEASTCDRALKMIVICKRRPLGVKMGRWSTLFSRKWIDDRWNESKKLPKAPFFPFDRELLQIICCCLNYCWLKKMIWSITNERFNALFWCDRSKLTNLSIFFVSRHHYFVVAAAIFQKFVSCSANVQFKSKIKNFWTLCAVST